MMNLPVIVTFRLCGSLYLPSVMLSLPWDRLPNFWHWVNWCCHCSCKVFSFWHYAGWGHNPPSHFLLLSSSNLLSQRGTFAYPKRDCTQTSKLPLACYLRSSLVRALYTWQILSSLKSAFIDKAAWYVVDCTLAGYTTFAPQRLGFFSRAWMLSLMRSRLYLLESLVVLCFSTCGTI